MRRLALAVVLAGLLAVPAFGQFGPGVGRPPQPPTGQPPPGPAPSNPQGSTGPGARTVATATLTLILAIGLPLLVPSLILIPPMWKLCSRAGFPRWFSFAMLIPLANITLLYFIAFSQWPSEFREQERPREPKAEPPPSEAVKLP
jgi:hypothetical protein